MADEPPPAGETLTIGSRPRRLDQVDTSSGSGGTPLALLLLLALVLIVAALALANHFGWLGMPLLATSPARSATAGGAVAAAPVRDRDADDPTGAPTAEVVTVDPRTDHMATRLVALLALAQRAQFERQGRPLPPTWDAVVDWVSSAGAAPGLEPHEQAILRRPTGGLQEAEVTMASWQVEGAAVVTWALGLLDEMPPVDQAVDPVLINGAVGFPDAARTLEVLRTAHPRGPEEVDVEVQRHERLLQTIQRAPAANGRPSAGDPEVVEVIRGITTERLRALYWLQQADRRAAVGIDG